MSGSSKYSDSGPSRQSTPHIRLNSGMENILTRLTDGLQPLQRPLQPTVYYLPPYLLREANHGRISPVPSHSRYRHGGESPRGGDTPPLQPSAFPPRQPSWSSEDSALSRNSRSPFACSLDDLNTPSYLEDDFINTQTVGEKYGIFPSSDLIIFPEDVEKDDDMHTPDPNDLENDCDCTSRRGLLNCGGLILLTLGILMLFIGYPMLTFVERFNQPAYDHCAKDPMCLDTPNMPLLKNVRQGLIDPDTPQSAMTRTTFTGKKQRLVFSDEFNKDGRTFYDGDDPYFQAVDLWYGVTADLQWYDPDAVTTGNGTLNIRFDAFQNHYLNYRSGMLQSWNKMCFKGGYMEASISLPGRGDTIGFWPGFWAMGNLGRPGYAATTDGMWPYTYDDICDVGITPNQSDPTGLSGLPGMRLPACTCLGEDHPTPGKSRSAPEIDAVEASVDYLDPPLGNAVGSASQSIQVAPFDVLWRPDYDFVEVYNPHITKMNTYQGSVYQQAASGVSFLNNHWYDGSSKWYQKYAFEYTPGRTGAVTWYVGEEATWTLDARSLGPNGNIGQRVIPEEPMAMVINFGMSNGFALLNLTGLADLMPATMRLDYVRIYQDEDNVMITCDPPGYPTTDYIAKHPVPYSNPNITHWDDTGYVWPKNSFMHGCKANDEFKG
ncbi:beta-glucan synthesis-associated protein KRE6 [Trichodelitschia bisporula]|uniref:Beta-glucan synthesis-associated protein KRE6 n=1 Tax=Trichodelitschia bisporula TaxID=703511 RepID=A0A6G1IA33_9PEZI|nr:beta-glucan synthesis-associated protein KRE6 [Trichodelitschia bisporula]